MWEAKYVQELEKELDRVHLFLREKLARTEQHVIASQLCLFG